VQYHNVDVDVVESPWPDLPIVVGSSGADFPSSVVGTDFDVDSRVVVVVVGVVVVVVVVEDVYLGLDTGRLGNCQGRENRDEIVRSPIVLDGEYPVEVEVEIVEPP
jgi:hypothetical protein